MKLQSPSPNPEKILLAGSGGAGKTNAVIDVARKCLADGQTMYVIDTEGAVPVLLESAGLELAEDWWGDEKVAEGDGQIIRYWARDWVEERAAIKGSMESAGRGDWVVVDSITHPWADVQSWWIGEVSGGREMGDWIAQLVGSSRNAGKRDEGVGEMLKEWKVINAQWGSYVRKPLMTTRGHVLVTAHAKSINPEHDKADVKSMWGPFRAKADAQKMLGHDVRTIVGMEQRGGAKGGWGMVVLKDWGRTEPGEALRLDVKSFAMDYLKGVAGWQMTK